MEKQLIKWYKKTKTKETNLVKSNWKTKGFKICSAWAKYSIKESKLNKAIEQNGSIKQANFVDGP